MATACRGDCQEPCRATGPAAAGAIGAGAAAAGAVPSDACRDTAAPWGAWPGTATGHATSPRRSSGPGDAAARRQAGEAARHASVGPGKLGAGPRALHWRPGDCARRAPSVCVTGACGHGASTAIPGETTIDPPQAAAQEKRCGEPSGFQGPDPAGSLYIGSQPRIGVSCRPQKLLAKLVAEAEVSAAASASDGCPRAGV